MYTWDIIWLTRLSRSLLAASASWFCVEHFPWDTLTGPESVYQFEGGTEIVEWAKVHQQADFEPAEFVQRQCHPAKSYQTGCNLESCH